MSRKIRQFMDLPLLCHSESQNLHTLSPYVVAIPKFWIMGDEEKTVMIQDSQVFNYKLHDGTCHQAVLIYDLL